MKSTRRALSTAAPAMAAFALVVVTRFSRAADPDGSPPSPAADAGRDPAEPEAQAVDAGATEVVPAASPRRASSAAPMTAEPPADDRARLSIDPIGDGALVIGATAFAGLLELVNSTGEIRPQQIAPGFERSQLLAIDRIALSQTIDDNASTGSNIGVLTAVGFAALDPILSGLRERSVQTGLVDGVLYVESMTLTWGLTNLVKMSVRRPRPQAYIDAERHKDDPTYSNRDTDSAVSFFSGHAAVTAAVASTAIYLAFVRAPRSARPWVTLALGTALTTFVSIERVRGGAHFPTDVIAGSIAGAGVGLLVPHLHRSESTKQRPVWIGIAPTGDGTAIQLGGLF